MAVQNGPITLKSYRDARALQAQSDFPPEHSDVVPTSGVAASRE